MAHDIRKIVWRAATALIIVYTTFVVARNLVHAFKIKTQINTLMQERRYYEEVIERDSTLLEELKYEDGLEKYAREHYRMRRPGDRVFYVE